MELDEHGRNYFKFASGSGSQLSGHLEPPEGTPRGWATFFHCFTCGRHSRRRSHLSRAGIGVLRFDFAGTGISGRTREAVSFASDVEDLGAAANAMAAAGMSPTLLVGHSPGGTAAIVAASDLPDIAAVVMIGTPADLQHILRVFQPDDLHTVTSKGEASVAIAGRPFLIRRSFLEAVARIDVDRAITSLGRPVLVMHSPLDQVVGIAHASRIFRASRHPKSFISLDTTDHLLTNVADANYVAAMVAAWASRFLPPLTTDLPQVEAATGVVAPKLSRERSSSRSVAASALCSPMSQHPSVVLEPAYPLTNWYPPASQSAQ